MNTFKFPSKLLLKKDQKIAHYAVDYYIVLSSD